MLPHLFPLPPGMFRPETWVTYQDLDPVREGRLVS